MQFVPKSEEELNELLPDGIYEFEVLMGEDCVSQSGNEQIKLTLLISNQEKQKIIFDYLTSKAMYKVKHFADVTGLEDKYSAGGYVGADCSRRRGHCKVGRQEAKDSYAAKNIIKDYVLAPEQDKSKFDEFKPDVDLPF